VNDCIVPCDRLDQAFTVDDVTLDEIYARRDWRVSRIAGQLMTGAEKFPADVAPDGSSRASDEDSAHAAAAFSTTRFAPRKARSMVSLRLDA
jgi:hypothetical protein